MTPYKASPSGQDGVLGVESMNGPIFQTQRDNSPAFPIFHDEIQGKIFNEVVCVVF